MNPKVYRENILELTEISITHPPVCLLYPFLWVSIFWLSIIKSFSLKCKLSP